MKRFILYTTAFLILVVAACMTLTCVFPYNPNGYVLAQQDKMEMLGNPDRKASIVLLGGSTVAFGYNSPLIEEAMGMPVINCGLHASLGMKCILDEAVPRLRRGDMLVFVPEIDQFYDNLPYGELEFTDWMVLSGFRSASSLNVRQWWSVVNNLPSHLRRRVDYFLYSKSGLLQEDVYRRDGFNRHGDLTAHWSDTSTVFHFERQRTFLNQWNESFFKYYLNTLSDLEKRGVRIVIIPTPLAQSEFDACLEQLLYAIRRINASPYPYALPFEQYIMPDTMFYDTPYHLRKPGADQQSLRLRELLSRRNTY